MPESTSYWGRSTGETRIAAWVGVGVVAFGSLFWVAVLVAPSVERVWRSDPLRDFISAETLLPPGPEASVGGQLVREADAALHQEMETALALWDSQGVIRAFAFKSGKTEPPAVTLRRE